MLFLAQVLFTVNSFSQIHYEEVANSVRNPFWLSQRTVYGGASSNIGWDGLLAIGYSLFGFSLFAGKYLRLVLQLISLFSLAALLKKYLGAKLATVPLLVIGLSPTLLFFNTLSAQYAVDLSFLPIVLYLLTSKVKLLRIFSWTVSMVAWMAFPPFIFYLPALGAIYLKKGLKISRELFFSILAFLFPLVAAFMYVENKQSLFYDSGKGNSGIFRGGGGQFPPGPGAIDLNLKNLFSDLFSKGVSYNFEAYKGEFSFVFPILVLILCLVLGVILLKQPKTRFIAFWAWTTFILNFLVYTFLQDLTGFPGIRRATPMLAVFYVFFSMGWYYLTKLKIQNSKLKVAGMGILSLLLIHHLIVYPVNLAHLKDPSPVKDATGFFETAATPQQSLKLFVQKAQKEDVYLKCQMMAAGELVNICRYGEMFAAIAGSCLWNNLSCKNIYGYDWNTNQYVFLTTKLWDDNTFEP